MAHCDFAVYPSATLAARTLRGALICFGLLLAILSLLKSTVAQGIPGCNQDINTNFGECPDAHNQPTEFGEACVNPGTGGAGPGASCQYCFEGYKPCPNNSKNSITTADWAYQSSCCAPTTCQTVLTCSPPTYWQGAPVCACTAQGSPIIVDTNHQGFQLTSAANGVVFDILGDGHPIQIAWTQAGSGNAFLALDRNHNGLIDSGAELFGNITQQPSSSNPNGFLALAEFDKPENGGNGDGIIDKRDAVFSQLLLWIDSNHDGISQPSELHSLPELGVFSLALKYAESARTDQFGNRFQYKATVNPVVGDGTSKDGRIAYDVFFAIAGQDSTATSESVVSSPSTQFSLDHNASLTAARGVTIGCPRPQQDSTGGTR